MRVARSRWFAVLIASVVWSGAWPGAVLAQDAATAFRPACALVTAEVVSTILGVEVTQGDAMPDSSCAYRSGTDEAATVRLDPAPMFALGRLDLPGATDDLVGGLPSFISTRGSLGTASADVLVALADGGTLGIQVSGDVGIASPLAAARALTEAILATGPVTAHASASPAEPIASSGDGCALVTVAELGQLTGRRFTQARPTQGPNRCRYRTKDGQSGISLGIGAFDLIHLRSDVTTSMTVAGRDAVFVPDLALLGVDLGGGRALSVRDDSTGKRFAADALPALTAAIAEMAIGRMAPVPVTCPLVDTDAVVAATGLVLRPMATSTGDWCWFSTPDEQLGLLLRITDRRLLATPNLRDLPAPTDLEVSGYQALGVSGPTETVLSVDLRRTRGKDREFFDLALLGSHPFVTDPLVGLQSIAVEVLDGLASPRSRQ